MRKYAVILLFTLALAASVPPVFAANAGRDWTVLVYMDADNNLEPYLMADIKEIERGLAANPEANIEVVFFADRAKGYDDAYGDWTGTRLYRGRPSVSGDEISSELIVEGDEYDMGDPRVLEWFIKELSARYPARRTALILWNHGLGWRGLLNDEDAPGIDGTSGMSIAELGLVLANTAPAMPSGKFDLVVFDMCLMGQAEVITEIAPYARYMVGAAPVTPWCGVRYDGIISAMARSADPSEVASEIVRSSCEGFLEIDQSASSMSAFDLSKADAFVEAFRNFSSSLQQVIPNGWNKMTSALFYAQNFGGRADIFREDAAIASVDIIDWLDRMKNITPGFPAGQADALRAAIADMMVRTERGPHLTHCNGLSVYAPVRADNMADSYRAIKFDRLTNWSTFLSSLHEAQNRVRDVPEIVSVQIGAPKLRPGITQLKSGADIDITPSDSVAPLSGADENPSWIKVVINGTNILWGYYGMAISDGITPSGMYTVLTQSLIQEENFDQEALERKAREAAADADFITPVFKDGINELAYKFGGLANRLSNGKESVLVTADYLDIDDIGHFTVDGTYSDSATGGDVQVTLKISTEFGFVDSMTAYDENTAYSIQPRAEGIFRPTLSKLDDAGYMSKVSGETLTWGDNPYVTQELVPEGRYIKFACWAESIGGNGGAGISNPAVVRQNPQYTPFIQNTIDKWDEYLLGGYCQIQPVARRDGAGMIMAPSGAFMKFANGESPDGNPVVTLDVKSFGRGLDGNGNASRLYVNFVPEGLPVMRVFAHENGNFSLTTALGCVLVNEPSGYFWRMVNLYTGMPNTLVPFDETNFPSGGIYGEWYGEDGSKLFFNWDGRASYVSSSGGGVSGQLSLTDNVVSVTPQNGAPLRMAYAPVTGAEGIVVTFDGDNGPAAMLYRQARTPQPAPAAQNPPPQQVIWLEGSWMANLNGQQILMTFQGNNYQVSGINGVVGEWGVFRVQGNMISGQMANGMTFQNGFQMSPDGRSFTMTYPNGGYVVYSRVR